MKTQAMWVLGCMALVAVGCGGVEQTTDSEAAPLMDQAYADESFRAAVSWLQKDRGIPVDLSQGVVEHKEGASRITFTLASEVVTQLAFEARADGTTRVYLNEPGAMEPKEEGPAAQVACGRYITSDSCTTGPYLGSSSSPECGGATLYLYKDYARDQFQYGRKVYQMGMWVSCSWMAQSTTCTNTCS
jgi:hypothetical protein